MGDRLPASLRQVLPEKGRRPHSQGPGTQIAPCEGIEELADEQACRLDIRQFFLTLSCSIPGEEPDNLWNSGPSKAYSTSWKVCGM